MSPSDTPFTEVTQLISYNWADQKDVNLIALHWSKPIIAYVINTGYQKGMVSKGHKEPAKPLDQMVRLLNYETQDRALCKPLALDSIMDIAFSCGQSSASDLLATLDKSSMINIFVFRETEFAAGATTQQLTVQRVLTIQPNLPLSFELKNSKNFGLSWCPYVAEEFKGNDPSTRLAVTYGSTLELFSFNDHHFKGENAIERSSLRKDLGEYFFLQNAHYGSIVSASISCDGVLVCSAGTDNKLRFFEIQDASEGTIPSLKSMREWSPSVQSPDTISAAFYLDDYDFLLSHPEHTFWGYILIGTTNGVMKIYDLQCKPWALTQSITIEYEKDDEDDSDDSGFKYFIDRASKVVLAVKGNTVFVFILDFVDEQQTTADDADGPGVARSPKFTQVARFSLYNPVISFQIRKSTNENAIEIFWVTLKSLEKCTVNIDKLTECSSSDVIAVKVANASSVSKAKQVHKVNPSTIETNLSLMGESFTDSSILSALPSSSRPTVPIAPASTAASIISSDPASDREAEIINRIRTSDEEINNLKRKQDGKTTTALPKPTKPLPIGTKVSESKRQSLPSGTSARVMSMFNTTTQSPVTSSSASGLPQVSSQPIKLQAQPFMNQQQQQHQQQVHHQIARANPSVPCFTPPSTSSMPQQLNDMAKFMLIENDIKGLEFKLLSEMQAMTANVSSTVKGIQNEIHSLRQEQNSLSKERALSERAILETTINKVVDLSMSQLNLVVSKGLQDFFDQTKLGINHLQSTVHNVKSDFEKVMQENSKKMSFIQNQLDIFQKQLEKSEAEQQLILLRIQQIANLYK